MSIIDADPESAVLEECANWEPELEMVDDPEVAEFVRELERQAA